MSEFFRYGLAGVVNTFVGYLAFLLFYRYMYWSPAISNVGGYAFGLVCAYFLNRAFVFSASANNSSRRVGRFILAFFIAFALNQLVLFVLHTKLGLLAEWAQIAAMLIYTIVFYFLNKWYVFPKVDL